MTDFNLAHPPQDVLLRGRLQLLSGTVELATGRLDALMLASPGWGRDREIRRIVGELRAAVEEATTEPVLDPADFIQQPH